MFSFMLGYNIHSVLGSPGRVGSYGGMVNQETSTILLGLATVGYVGFERLSEGFLIFCFGVIPC